MTKFHKILFKAIELYCWVKNIVVGRTVYVFSHEKQAWISGKIKSISGQSVNWRVFETAIKVNFDHPLQGDSRDYYMTGVYQLGDIGKRLRFIVPLNSGIYSGVDAVVLATGKGTHKILTFTDSELTQLHKTVHQAYKIFRTLERTEQDQAVVNLWKRAFDYYNANPNKPKKLGLGCPPCYYKVLKYIEKHINKIKC